MMDSHTTHTASDTMGDLDQERQRLIEQLLAEEGLDAPAAPTIRPRDAGVAVPVTFAQEVLWLLDRATPGLTAYNSPLARRIQGPLNIAALEHALTALIARHETLRTVFHANGDSATQVVLPAERCVLPVHDVRTHPAAEREGAALTALRTAADTPFDLSREPGFRAALACIADDDHVLLLLTHHIVSDAWSYGVMFRELNALYEAAVQERNSDLLPPPLQFGDYAVWQRTAVHGAMLDEGLEYWRRRLAELPELELPTDYSRPAVQGFAGARRSIVLPASVHSAVRALAQQHGVTTYMVLLAAYATVLHRYTGQDDITIGSAVAGRTRAEMESLIGYFSRALPMRVSLAETPSFATLLSRVSETVLGAFEHQDTPLESLVLELERGRAQSHAPLFRVVLTMQDTLGAELQLGTAAVSPVELDASSTKFDLTLLCTERADGLEMTLWFRTDLFGPAYAERFLNHLSSVIGAAVADPTQPISAISLLTEPERAQLGAWNATTVDEGSATTLASSFEAHASRVPTRPAVVAADATLSYAELNARANRLARHLQSLGVGPNTPVALGIDRSADALVGLLGIMKAGGCYVPLPPDVPAARRATQLRESGAPVLVTQAGDVTGMDIPSTVTVVALDRDAEQLGALAGDDVSRAASPDALAYVLYTSGSTGVPKGVAVTHANAMHYARAVSRVLADIPREQPGDGFATFDAWHFGVVSTLGADLGNTSVLLALASGGTLHVLSKETAMEPARFAEYVAAHPLDVLKITPNHFHALTAGKPGDGRAELMPRRWLVLGGEALLPNVALALCKAGAGRVLNHYGPTETTVGVSTFAVTDESVQRAVSCGAHTVPIGNPIANTKAFVVDTYGNEQPVGIPGELWFAGAGVAQGYLHRPELTAERFVERNGERVYRTGDLARRLPDGSIEFLGRVDNQVKIRGYRVELGDIEHALLEHPGVERAVAVVHTTDGADAQLVAYIVSKPLDYALSHSHRPTPEHLTQWIAARLPEYMVPSAVMILDTLPLTPNGKVDRARLPIPNGGADAPGGMVAPRTSTETQLVALWADVLKREQISVTDNFFALGGQSLLAIRLLGKISKTFGVRLPLRSLFESPTVEQIAVAVDQAVAGA
jgi:amino acid adenylation domain-containing protein